ncbi:MAG: hypothetical protein KJ607_01705 [Bacteroidetes bacterium]|nr:hypothetical protein [Bacteroidota bacterium]
MDIAGSYNQGIRILKSRIFIAALLLLIINDLALKAIFHNWLTGKLSDFTGLFVFTGFFIAVLPRYRSHIMIITALLFAYWKSPCSEYLIYSWNQLPLFNVARIPDYSDLWALAAIQPAYVLSFRPDLPTFKIPVNGIAVVCLFAFTATSYSKEYHYNKSYHFHCNKKEVIDGLNDLAQRNDSLCFNSPLSFDSSYADTFLISGTDTSWYSVKGYKNGIAQLDTLCIMSNGIFFYHVPVKEYMKESRTGYCTCLKAKLTITGEDSVSMLMLNTYYIHNCMGMFEDDAKKNEKNNLLEAFENEIIIKLINR